MSNILIIAPHADDEILGCGATIAKAVANGNNVIVLICTNASVGAPELFSVETIQTVRNEALASHASIGVRNTIFWDLPAPALDQYPSYKISNNILLLIREHNIDTVYIPHRGDCHKDHRIIHEAAMVACRPLPNSPVKRIYAYETLSETEWGEPIATDFFIPTKYQTFTEEEFERKIEAMSCFQSQLHSFPASRSLEAIIALAKYRGACVSQVRAEAFEVIRDLD